MHIAGINWVAVLAAAAAFCIIALTMPGITALGLLIAIAAWSLMIGVLQIVTAIKLRREVEGEFWLGSSRSCSVCLSWPAPGEGALAVIWLIGAYAIIFGILRIAFAFGRAKSRPQQQSRLKDSRASSAGQPMARDFDICLCS